MTTPMTTALWKWLFASYNLEIRATFEKASVRTRIWYLMCAYILVVNLNNASSNARQGPGPTSARI